MPIDTMLLHLHVKEIERKTAMALANIPSLNQCLQNSGETFDLFYYLHSILVNSAAVSISFWPTREKYHARGEALRKGFGLDDEILSLKDRTLRNHIVHFDERLDEWFETSQNHNIAHCLI
ncbi:MAG: hypothetical protein R3256_13720, partial [Thalassovita sp.]|nr:hypothetical protein [Thalassovita sp.]